MASFDNRIRMEYLAKHIGQKRAREIFFLGLEYTAQEAFDMGMVNAVVPHADIEKIGHGLGNSSRIKLSLTFEC